LRERQVAEQQKARDATKADMAISAFKALAAKREGKALGYRDSGKNWNALPEGAEGRY
jgi:hypothetical protein